MHTARLRLKRAGIASSASDSARSLSRHVQERWAEESTSASMAAALSDWLLDMERLRYAPSSSTEANELKILRRRWRSILKQRWPQNHQELKT